MLWTGPGDRHPRHEHVEQPDADDAQDGGTRDDLLRVAGLLAVHGRRLEPHPRPEGKEEPQPGAGSHDSGSGLEGTNGVECLAHREPIRAAAVEQHRERTQRQHEDLGQQEDTEDLGGDVDVVEGENRVQPNISRAGRIQCTWTPNREFIRFWKKNEKMPISEPSKTTYAMVINKPLAMPTIRPSPWAM